MSVPNQCIVIYDLQRVKKNAPEQPLKGKAEKYVLMA
jgi:hypothetical protein